MAGLPGTAALALALLCGLVVPVSTAAGSGGSSNCSAASTACPCSSASVLLPDGSESGRCECVGRARCTDPLCTRDVNGVYYFAQSCPSCSCALAPEIYEVVSPTYGDEWKINLTYPIQWRSTPDVARVWIKLYNLTFNNGLSAPSLSFVADLLSNAPNTGTFAWTISNPELLPQSTFLKVAVCDTATCGGLFALSPEFNVDLQLEGPCPAGQASASGSYPGCTPCPQGSYADVTGAISCSACDPAHTTDGLGASSAVECDRPASFAYTITKDQTVQVAAYKTLAMRRIDRCELACSFDLLCKAFVFEPTMIGMQGKCSLLHDTRTTAPIHALRPLSGAILYEKRFSVLLAAVAFNRTADAYLRRNVLAQLQMVSLEACAAACLDNATCLSFNFGTGSLAGSCFLSDKTALTAAADFEDGRLGSFHELDYFERLTGPACALGDFSPSGDAPGCTACPVGSYADATSRVRCLSCPDDTTTTAPGSTSASACIPFSCPAGTVGTASGDCACPRYAKCDTATASQCTCTGTPADCAGFDGTWTFPNTCQNCACGAPRPPSILSFVRTPLAGETLFLQDQYNITYDSQAVSQIQVQLYRAGPRRPDGLTPLTRVGYVDLRTPATGSYVWTVGDVFLIQGGRRVAVPVPTSDDLYSIVIFHYFVSTSTDRNNAGYATSFLFNIKDQPSGCSRGLFNAANGRHPCSLCPLDTFWVNSTFCAPCPSGSKTKALGSQSVNDCSVNASQALFSFSLRPLTYFSGSNAAGYNVETIDHKTPEECARMCLDDAGCKAFDAGVIGQSQEGDCFMSYDSVNTIPKGDIRQYSTLNLYLRNTIGEVLGTQFSNQSGCHLVESDEGGRYEGIYTPETCAQLCLNDGCCLSFDAGTGSKLGHCFLSYDSRATAAPGQFVCDPSAELDYFEKTNALSFVFAFSYDAELATAADQRDFETAVTDAIRALPVQTGSAGLLVSVFRVPTTGQVGVSAVFPSAELKAAVSVRISQSQFGFVFKKPFGAFRTAKFTANYGPCTAGAVSQTGNSDATCQTCRSGTYANQAQTICVACPEGTTSLPGASSILLCKAPKTDARSIPFAIGDEWIGTFGSSSASGALTLQVVEISGLDIRFLSSFRHGGACDPAQGCRVPGFTQYYLDGIINVDQLNARADLSFGGWAGITDRSFPRRDLNGRIRVRNNRTEYFGTYADGSFVVTKRCEATDELGFISTGDKWLGHYECIKTNPDGSEAADGQLTVRRLEIVISAQSPVVALVDFDHGSGIGQYQTDGLLSACGALRLVPAASAWQTGQPANVPARLLSGQISEDGEFFRGQVLPNPNCACTGQSSPGSATRGSFCGRHGESGPGWCFVSPLCPEAVLEGNLHRAQCDGYETCTAFQLARVCSTVQSLCPPGWFLHERRCYAVINEAKNFSAAEASCAAMNTGALASLLSASETAFVQGLIAEFGFAAWVGLRRQASQLGWVDGSLALVPPLSASSAGDCGFMNRSGLELGACGTELPFVCKAATVGINASCACSGQSDASGFGASCSRWEPTDAEPWCYTSEFCARSIERNNSGGLFWTACQVPPPVTTAVPTTMASCHLLNASEYTADDGSCLPCVSRCAPGTALVGACDEFRTPVCVACHPTCAVCTAPGSDQCTSCAPSLFRSADGRRCVKACSSTEYTDVVTRTCNACDVSCQTCSGPTPRECSSCSPGRGLFLFAASSECIQDCGTKGPFFADAQSASCRACRVCSSTEFQTTPCAATTDTACTGLRACQQGVTFQATAPTQTSDRVCQAVRTCSPGQEETSAPTLLQDRGCADCAAGFTDLAQDASGCSQCPLGTYAPMGWRGPCQPCPSGTASTNPAAPCVSCAAGTFQSQPGQSACATVATCQPGLESVFEPTVSSDRVCRACQTPDNFKPSSGTQPCQAVSDCPAGTEEDVVPTATSDRVCRPCASGAFKDRLGNFACSPLTTCPAGTAVAVAGTSSSDRVCRPCATGTFSDAPNVAGCSPVRSCAAGEYASVAPTPSSDRGCSPFTVCLAATYARVPGTPVSDVQCAALTACGTQEWQETPPLPVGGPFVSDRVCVACSQSCPPGVAPLSPCTASADWVCASCVTCQPGVMYEAVPCDAQNPGVCHPCATCQAWQFRASPCTPVQDTVCTNITQCSAGEFLEVAATSVSDAVCVPVTPCQPGSGEATPPTATSDRVCEACRTGFTFLNGSVCSPVSQCLAGEAPLASTPSMSGDTVCRPCAAGSFKAGPGNAACQPGSPCPIGHRIATAASGTQDTVCTACATGTFQDQANQAACKPVSLCQPGEQPRTSPTITRDRECEACPADRFQAVAGAAPCTPAQVCVGGSGESQAPTATSDRACAPCQAGATFRSAGATAATCQPVSDCPPGTEQRAGGTASSDRVCGACSPPLTFNGATNGACLGTLLCAPGFQEATAPTATSNRACEPCPAGSFKDVAGASQCMRHRAACTAGFRESVAPSLSTDRTCEPCAVANREFQDEAGRNSCKRLSDCAPGAFAEVAGSSIQDRSCRGCPAGTFSASENAPACLACPAGEFQDAIGQVRCKPTTRCQVGQAVAAPPSASQDRTCRLCNGIDEYQNGLPGDSQVCRVVTVCAEGKEEDEAPSPVSDRTCRCIPGETFQAREIYNPAEPCDAVSRCGPGQEEFSAPTLSTDRVCNAAEDRAVVFLSFDRSYEADITSPRQERLFVEALHDAIQQIPDLPEPLLLASTLAPGSIVSRSEVSPASAAPLIEAAARAGLLRIGWPDQFSAEPATAVSDNRPKASTLDEGGKKNNFIPLVVGIVAGCAVLAAAIVFAAVYRHKRQHVDFNNNQYETSSATEVEFSNPLYFERSTSPGEGAYGTGELGENSLYDHPAELDGHDAGGYLDVSFADQPQNGHGYLDVNPAGAAQDGGYLHVQGGSTT